MAKFEESDPRWKVKDMGDQGKNVNGWCACICACACALSLRPCSCCRDPLPRHWNEKDVFPYFKEQFTAKFDDKVIFEGAANGPAGLLCDFKCWKLDKCTGEARCPTAKAHAPCVERTHVRGKARGRVRRIRRRCACMCVQCLWRVQD